MLVRTVLAAAALSAALAAAPPEPARWEVAGTANLDGCPGVIVFFKTGSSTLSEEAKTLLDQHLPWMRDMVVAGAWLEANAAIDHTEAQSGYRHLARRRGEAVRAHLAARGIDPLHVRVQDRGASRPLVAPKGKQLTRRELDQNRFVNVAPLMPRKVFQIFFPPGGPIC
ncbi:MAG TPA: OmpA family protein [Allosphingosinicella sp.]|nr:OmpA family protein [Allosphingosinicella sp.]